MPLSANMMNYPTVGSAVVSFSWVCDDASPETFYLKAQWSNLGSIPTTIQIQLIGEMQNVSVNSVVSSITGEHGYGQIRNGTFADDLTVVHNTGNETIAGTKTFSNTISTPAITGVITDETDNTNVASVLWTKNYVNQSAGAQIIDIITPSVRQGSTLYIPVNCLGLVNQITIISGKFMSFETHNSSVMTGIGSGMSDGWAAWYTTGQTYSFATMLNFPRNSTYGVTFSWVSSIDFTKLYLKVVYKFTNAYLTSYIRFMGFLSNVTFGTPITSLETTVNTTYIQNGNYSYTSIQ
jgi:hypothetical protein